MLKTDKITITQEDVKPGLGRPLALGDVWNDEIKFKVNEVTYFLGYGFCLNVLYIRSLTYRKTLRASSFENLFKNFNERLNETAQI